MLPVSHQGQFGSWKSKENLLMFVGLTCGEVLQCVNSVDKATIIVCQS